MYHERTTLPIVRAVSTDQARPLGAGRDIEPILSALAHRAPGRPINVYPRAERRLTRRLLRTLTARMAAR